MAAIDRFPALIARETADGKYQAAIEQLTLADLPDEDVLVEVDCSTVNYKDGLAVSGKGKIIRKFPMVCGIDLAGTVVESRSPDWQPGDKVLVNGHGLSERFWGGFSRYQRLKPEWLVRRPDVFSAAEAMAIGTAGYTAMLCVLALAEAGIGPERGEIVVTGAAGGVGSVAIGLLAARGYRVAAATGRPETHDYLRGLGATSFVAREELAQKGGPLQSERWAGGVDSVGSQTLATVLAQTVYGGAVAACGLAGGADLPTTVLPFILRGVRLLGVDSVMAPRAAREAAWAALARELPKDKLGTLTQTAKLADVPDLAEAIVAGRIRGRVVVEIK